MTLLKAELFRSLKTPSLRKTVLLLFFSGLTVFFFRLLASNFNLYRSPNAWQLFAYVFNALLFLTAVFSVQFIHQQYLTDHQRGLVKQILTSGAERKDYALGRILSVISIWGTIVITISLIFLAVSLLSAPGGDIKEQNYIFYTSGEMLLAVLISLIGIITAFTAFWLLLLNLFFLLGSPAFLLGLLLGIAAFFIPLDIPWLYFFPGIDIAYFPDILGKLASSLPVDKSLITYSALTNNTIWIITGFFSLRHIVNHKDFITAE